MPHLDTLQSLVEKSLLRFTNERYWMLETIREYAVERLEESEDATGIRDVHAEWFLRLATDAEPRLHGSEQLRWLDCLETERGNLRAALAWGLGGGDRQVGLRLGGLLMWFWQLRSYLGEGEAWLAAATSEAEHQPAAVRARLLQGQGQLTYYKGDPGEAQRLLDQALGLWRASGDLRGTAETLVYLGVAAGDSDEPILARSAGEESVSLARQLGDDWLLGFALWALGVGYAFGSFGAEDQLRASPGSCTGSGDQSAGPSCSRRASSSSAVPVTGGRSVLLSTTSESSPVHPVSSRTPAPSSRKPLGCSGRQGTSGASPSLFASWPRSPS